MSVSFRALAISVALLGVATSCGKSESDVPSIRSVLAERALRARPDSFTLAADNGRVLGDSLAPVWFIIVSDFQCPDCKRWHDEIFPLLREEYVSTGRVRMAYVNMPLGAHLNAMSTALAAACASAQGKFWETHDRIFDTQSQWIALPDARPFLDSLAIAAGVDSETQRVCTERARATRLIRMDVERSRAGGADTVPTFLIGTHRLIGLATVATFRAVIDSAIAGK